MRTLFRTFLVLGLLSTPALAGDPKTPAKDAKPAPADTTKKAPDAKPTEAKPAPDATKKTEAKPTEAKPTEAKPADKTAPKKN